MHPGIPSARSRGFTLVELMVVVVIAAVLAVVAVPSLQATIQANQLDTVANQLLAALATARSEAVRAPDATVQVSNPQGGGTDWKSGWTTSTQTGAAAAITLQSATPVPGQVSVVSNNGGPISFDARGRLVLGTQVPPPTLVFVICADGATLAGKSRAVVVSPSGRARIAHVDATTGLPVLDDGTSPQSCTNP